MTQIPEEWSLGWQRWCKENCNNLGQCGWIREKCPLTDFKLKWSWSDFEQTPEEAEGR